MVIAKKDDSIKDNNHKIKGIWKNILSLTYIKKYCSYEFFISACVRYMEAMIRNLKDWILVDIRRWMSNLNAKESINEFEDFDMSCRHLLGDFICRLLLKSSKKTDK